MVRKPVDVEKSLVKKGFHRSDHSYYFTKAGKKTSVFTKTSHGAKELDDSLLGLMARQCKLSRQNFELLIECPLDRDTYERKLVESGVIESQTLSK